MNSYRNNPDGPENTEATRQHRREVFALKTMKDIYDTPCPNPQADCVDETSEILKEKNKALSLVWDWCTSDNVSDIDGDYIKRILDL